MQKYEELPSTRGGGGARLEKGGGEDARFGGGGEV